LLPRSASYVLHALPILRNGILINLTKIQKQNVVYSPGRKQIVSVFLIHWKHYFSRSGILVFCDIGWPEYVT
jgi:hypothetical protein